MLRVTSTVLQGLLPDVSTRFGALRTLQGVLHIDCDPRFMCRGIEVELSIFSEMSHAPWSWLKKVLCIFPNTLFSGEDGYKSNFPLFKARESDLKKLHLSV